MTIDESTVQRLAALVEREVEASGGQDLQETLARIKRLAIEEGLLSSDEPQSGIELFEPFFGKSH